MAATIHIQDELASNPVPVIANTKFGNIIGGRVSNGAAAWLEIPYGIMAGRFEDPLPLPPDFRYAERSYTKESSYAFQPNNDGQQGTRNFEDKVGYGRPTENALFLNIIAPPSFPQSAAFPVKVYIHGGFLQFGAPHDVSSSAHHISTHRSEVWVNIGYRLSAFGFLASDEPSVPGNFGFKDQWLALEWIQSNIQSFGGDPKNVQITGISAGAHSVHQHLHHASRLAAGRLAPFQSAVLQSNAILAAPKTPTELRVQYRALCSALGLDPDDMQTLSILKNPLKVASEDICRVIETDKLGVEHGTFRGCADGEWLPASPDVMEWQRGGGFARGLLEAGVKSIVVGDLTEEWYLYSIAHAINTPDDIPRTLERYFRADLVRQALSGYPQYQQVDTLQPQVLRRLFGEILADLKVHIPVRILHRDLLNSGFPVVRYEIRWVPDENRTEGFVTHGSDRAVWTLNVSKEHLDVATAWHDRVAREVELAAGEPRSCKEVLVLDVDHTICWTEDARWEQCASLW